MTRGLTFMPSRTRLSLLAIALLGAPLSAVMPLAPAEAAAPGPETPLTLKAVHVEGNKAIPTADILKAFGYHAGEKVTQNELKAAQDRVGQLYTQHNVGGSLGQKLRMTGNSVLVTIMVTEQAASPAATTPQALMLDSVQFKGNSAIPTDDLLAVTHLRAGQAVSDATVTADESAIQAAYAKKGISVKIQPVATYPNHDNHVVLVWQIAEKP